MSLSSGTRLGPYEILEPQGAGGMGEVYRARDTRLDRIVAVKVLPQHLRSNHELQQRFEREARTISSLQHPNICTLHDVGHQDGTDFLVMEFLEGESLAERLKRGPLAAEELLRIAIEIGDGLGKAHRQGVLHRDLKPGNIMLTKSGAKLLDFGLAKPAAAAMGSAASAGLMPTAAAASPAAPTSPITSQGMIVGTFNYMSPEQVEGREAGARSDIFSFGAVLYEMATGMRAFEGKSQISVASAILDRDPEPVRKLAPMTPPALERAIERALAKDPEERWQTMRDLVLELKWVQEAGSQAGVPAPVVSRRKHRERALWGVAGLALVAAIIAGAGWLTVAMQPERIVRAHILPPPKSSFVFLGPTAGLPAVSPDGARIVYAARRPDGQQALWVRSINAFAEQVLTGTENGSFPFWSPDSRYIGFFADGKLKKIEANGGPVESLADAVAGRGGSWSEDSTIIFAPGPTGPLMKVAAAGGQAVELTRLASGQNGHRLPWFLPDGKHFLFYGVGGLLGTAPTIGMGTPGGVYLGSLSGDLPVEGKLLFRNEWNAVYASPGYVLYLRENTLMARPFTARRLDFAGDPFPVAEHVAGNGGFFNGVFSTSRNGMLAYVGGAAALGGWQLTWFDRSGKESGHVGLPGAHFAPRLSPDQSKVAFFSRDSSGNADIWVYDMKRNVPSRFTFEPSVELTPVWSPDGASIYFSSNRRGQFTVFRKPASGMGVEEQVLEDAPTADCRVQSISADGKHLAYIRLDSKGSGKWEVWVLPLSGDRKPFPFLKSGFDNVYPQFSPDGKWMAYASNESGKQEIYVIPFPGAGAKWQISNSGGIQPRWRRDGKELFYYNLGHIMAVSVSSSGVSFQAGVPHELFTVSAIGYPNWMYDASADGKRFLFTSGEVAENAEPISVVVNWPAGIKKQ